MAVSKLWLTPKEFRQLKMTDLLTAIHFIDALTADFFANLRTPLLTDIFTRFTMLGSPMATTIITLIAAIIIYKTNKPYLAPLLTTSIGAGLTIYITKIIIHRQRPLDALITEKTFSFPSGHALISVALFGLLAYMIYDYMKQKNRTASATSTNAAIITITTVTLLILSIGISRLYLGVHYLSDVLAGYLIGAIWLAIGMMMRKAET